MASLTITIGALTATVSANNTKATNLLNAYADAIGAQGTSQERANAVVAALARHMQQQAQQQVGRSVTAAAIASANAEIAALTWE